MAKWKIRGDYTFYDKKGNPVQNDLGPDKSVKKTVIIDDKENPVEGQEHKLELVKDIQKAPKVVPPEQPAGDQSGSVNTDKVEEPKNEEVNHDTAGAKQGNTAKVQQPKSVQPVQSTPSGVPATYSKQDPEQPAGDK
jgi:hypothetical protein